MGGSTLPAMESSTRPRWPWGEELDPVGQGERRSTLAMGSSTLLAIWGAELDPAG